MAELSALRARLRDRQVKSGALGTTEMSVCLDMSLISELEQLQEEQAQWSVDHKIEADDRSLASRSVAPENPLDEQVEAKQAEIAAASIIVVFRALSSDRYERIANQFEDVDGEDRLRWLDALVEACYAECWSEGVKYDKDDMPWSEIKPEMSFGEIDDARSRVFTLNRRKQDIPFSSQPSKKPRPLVATSKLA
jgi:hypothetical protein